MSETRKWDTRKPDYLERMSGAAPYIGCAIHHEFIVRHLSPGGSADLLAASLFAYRLQATLYSSGKRMEKASSSGFRSNWNVTSIRSFLKPRETGNFP